MHFHVVCASNTCSCWRSCIGNRSLAAAVVSSSDGRQVCCDSTRRPVDFSFGEFGIRQFGMSASWAAMYTRLPVAYPEGRGKGAASSPQNCHPIFWMISELFRMSLCIITLLYSRVPAVMKLLRLHCIETIHVYSSKRCALVCRRVCLLTFADFYSQNTIVYRIYMLCFIRTWYICICTYSFTRYVSLFTSSPPRRQQCKVL